MTDGDHAERAAEHRAPNHLAEYAYELVASFSRFYEACHILSEPDAGRQDVLCPGSQSLDRIVVAQMPPHLGVSDGTLVGQAVQRAQNQLQCESGSLEVRLPQRPEEGKGFRRLVAAEQAEAIDAAAEALGDIYSVNVFPQMNVWWDTYPNHIGHEQSDGCTRCHNRRMRTADREQISDDCDTCHLVLAEEEENPDLVTMLQSE